MVKHYFKSLAACLLLFHQLNAHDRTPVKDKTPASSRPLPAETAVNNAAFILEADQQLGLDEAIRKLQSTGAFSAPAFDPMEDLALTINAAVEDDRSKARKLMAYLDSHNDKITSALDFESLMTLPVGLKKTLSDNSEVMIGIYSVEFDNSQGAEATLFCRLITQVETGDGGREEREILFGVSGVRFTKKGGLMSNEIKAVLLGDFTIPAKNWTIKLNGAPAMGVPSSSQTYLAFDCNGFKQVNINADIIFPRNVIVPYDIATRTAKDGRVSMNASATINSGFRDLILTATGNAPFAVAGFEKFGFGLTGLVVDMSDLSDNTSMQVPAGYSHPDRDGSGRWRGVALQNLTVYFPKEFEKESGTDISINGVIVDNTGFTGKVSYSSSTGLVFAAQKWQYSVKSFNVEFLQNKFVSGGFGGGFYTPVNGKVSDAGNMGFSYSAVIHAGGTYKFTVTTDAQNVPIKAWKAKGNIYKGSSIEMVVSGGKFYPSCNLSGELNISANKVNGDATEGFDEDANATARFNGIVFENLSIRTVPGSTNVDLSIGGFKYLNSDNARIAKIPVAITRFEKDAQSPAGEIWLGLGFRISLLKDKMSGSTDLTLRSKYNTATGKLELGTSSGKSKVGLNKLYIEGSSTAFSAVGYLELFENKAVFGKGFDGNLMVAIYQPFEVGVEVEATFGRTVSASNEEFRYGYFSAYVGAPKKLVSPPGAKPVFEAGTPSGTGFKIPTGMGDLAINGIGLAIYFNMKPVYNAGVTGQVQYVPNNTIPFGLKAMLGIQNSATVPDPPSFVGNVVVDFSLSSTHGINSIGVFGKGTFAVKNPLLNLGVGSIINGSSDADLKNQGAANHTTAGVAASANKVPDVKDADLNAPSEIRVAVGFLLDVPNKTAHLEAVVDMNMGNLKGIGTGGRVGKLVLHFEPSNNYFYLGRSPYNERVGLRYGNNFEIGVYVMAGKGLSPFPLPPPEVVTFFPSLQSRLNTMNLTSYSNPNTLSGFAVGAHIKANIDVGGWLGSIQGSAIGGFDLLLAKGTSCAPNSWLGQMQVYAIAHVKAKVVKVTVFNGGLGVYLYGQGLKPFGANGDVCLVYGRKNKRLCLSFKVGTTNC